MIVYLSNIFAFTALRITLFIARLPAHQQKSIFLFVTGFLWIFISTFRDLSVGADTYWYSITFLRDSQLSWGEILDTLWGYLAFEVDAKDPGYLIVIKLISGLGGNYTALLGFIAILFIWSLTKFISKYSNDYWLSFLIYSVLFYSFFSITGHRQTIATALGVLIGYQLLREKRYLSFSVILFLAALVHKSVLVFLLFVVIRKIKLEYLTIIITCLAIAFSYIFRQQLFVFFSVLSGYDYAVIASGEAYFITFFMVSLFAVCIWRVKPLARTQLGRDCFYATALALFFLPLVAMNPSLMRIVQYFSIFSLLLIPLVLNGFRYDQRVVIKILALVLGVSLLIVRAPEYLFIFQSGEAYITELYLDLPR